VVPHLPPLRLWMSPPWFNPHSAPPPGRRFSSTGSLTYRPRDTRPALICAARRGRQV